MLWVNKNYTFKASFYVHNKWENFEIKMFSHVNLLLFLEFSVLNNKGNKGVYSVHFVIVFNYFLKLYLNILIIVPAHNIYYNEHIFSKLVYVPIT